MTQSSVTIFPNCILTKLRDGQQVHEHNEVVRQTFMVLPIGMLPQLRQTELCIHVHFWDCPWPDSNEKPANLKRHGTARRELQELKHRRSRTWVRDSHLSRYAVATVMTSAVERACSALV
jgi:hypothetical protein